MSYIHRISIIVIACAGAGCGDDYTIGLEPSNFELLCGHEGPVRILPLEVDPSFHSAGALIVGDRYLFTLRSKEAAESPATSDVWSVGHCGEDPVQLLDDVDLHSSIRVHPSYDDVVFVCDETSGWITALDIYGVRPPNQVFETRECFSEWTDFGVLTILGEGDTGPLTLQPWPADPLAGPAEQIVLVDEVKAAAQQHHTWPTEREVFRTTATEAFAITASDELLAIDLDSHALTVLAEDVREFDGGAQGRWLIWQGTEVTSSDPEWPQGPIFVLDRESGQISEIDETALAFTVPDTMLLEPLGLLHYRVGSWGDDSADRWVHLPSLQSYSIGGGMQPAFAIDDTRALLSRYFGPPYVVLDTATTQATTIYDGPSSSMWADEQGLLVLKKDGGELVRVSYSGESRTLARHATDRYWLASDDRVVTAFAVGADKVGQLVIVDPETLDERTIEHDVHAFSSMSLEQDEGLIVGYLVVDPDPERYGVWIAKPAK